MQRLLDWAIRLLPIVLPLYVWRFKIGPLPTTFLEIYILVFIALWGVLKFTERKKIETRPSEVTQSEETPSDGVSTGIRINIRKWKWPIVAWLVATLVAVVIAPDRWAAFGHWRAFMLEPVLVFWVLMDYVKNGKTPSNGISTRVETLYKNLLFGIAIVTVALGVYAVIQYFTGIGIPSPWGDIPGRRATGIFGYPNGLSLFAAPFGVVCFMEWLRRVWDGERQSTRLLFLLGAASAATSVLLAKSMGGILAFGIGVVLTLIIKKQTRKIGYILAILGILGSIFAGLTIYRTQLHPSNIGENVANSKKWSSMVRTIIWQESAQIIKDHPLLGTGLRSYPTAILPYHKATWMEVFPHPHNIVLMLWIETGLAGLLAFIWLCYTWVVVSHQSTVISRKSSVDSSKQIPRPTDERRLTTDDWLWTVPLLVILSHGMVDMPFFKNDLAVQFWILSALATVSSGMYHRAAIQSEK